ncbi:MAG: hypothetical protein HFI86_02155 [Bacilli bacterium]|nr:hypothetical protein [Bacilli bacterium]
MNKELKATMRDLQDNPKVKYGSYEFIGDSNITYADIYNLLKYIKTLVSQLQSKKQELKGFVTTISKYLELEESEHTTYDEIIEKIVNLKGSAIKLQQSHEIIKEEIKFVKSLSSKGRDCMIYADVKKDILDILNKYKNVGD